MRGKKVAGDGIGTMPVLKEMAKAPSTLMRFQKYPFLSRRKRSKIFSSTLAFSYRFHAKTRENDENDWDLGLRMC